MSPKPLNQLLRRVSRQFHETRDRMSRHRATQLIHGPPQVSLGPTETMVVLLVRNGAWFLPRFLDHHFGLGAAHILVIDNGSTDDTALLAQRDRVTILRNALPARLHESGLRSELAQRVARGGWLLFADADELAELPLQGGLERLTAYCNARGFTAVLGQMLERFSDRPLAELRTASYDECIAAMEFYSLDQIEYIPYFDEIRVEFSWFLRQNHCTDSAVHLARGGLRAEIFGEMPFLTKHSLVRNLPDVTPMVHPHAALNVNVADVTLLLHHYKLAGDWITRDRAGLSAHLWDHAQDAARLAVADRADFAIAPAHPRRWHGIDRLVDEGFLQVSAGARDWTGPARQPGPGTP